MGKSSNRSCRNFPPSFFTQHVGNSIGQEVGNIRQQLEVTLIPNMMPMPANQQPQIAQLEAQFAQIQDQIAQIQDQYAQIDNRLAEG
jgi:hypothetical protein